MVYSAPKMSDSMDLRITYGFTIYVWIYEGKSRGDCSALQVLAILETIIATLQ